MTGYSDTQIFMLLQTCVGVINFAFLVLTLKQKEKYKLARGIALATALLVLFSIWGTTSGLLVVLAFVPYLTHTITRIKWHSNAKNTHGLT